MDTIPRFGDYQVIRQIGDGGMARVYLAKDSNGAHVVLKVAHSAFADDPDFRQRILSEKDALCRLNHPCIAIFKNFHEDWNPPVLVMEYVEGQPLNELLNEQSGPWSVDRTCAIVLQIAEALAYCHDAGIIHRDIKPANILITSGDHVKVTDFGIARLKDVPSVTVVGFIVGSALYMAPEQWRAEELTDKVDIYALGVVAYRMLTGRYPFEGSSSDLQAAHLYEHPPSPRALNPDLPPPLSDLILECLNKDPRLRVSSAEELIHRLKRLRPLLEFYGRYRFEEEIGRGAMGVVFRGTRREDGMRVAIKTLDQKLSDPSLLKRLRSEANVLAKLNHRFICKLIEARESFLVMEYVSGETLSDCIRTQEGLPFATARSYFRDILQAVGAAHRKNIIHRDLKPSNIIITDDPIESHAIVMDFGIAKLLGSSGLTKTSEGLGAVPYKAPELWNREAPDQRSDIYALGALLFEMVTNGYPYPGPEPEDFERQHLTEALPSLPNDLKNRVPRLEPFLHRCLAKNPDDRFAAVDEMYTAFSVIVPEPEVPMAHYPAEPPTEIVDPPTETYAVPGNAETPTGPEKVTADPDPTPHKGRLWKAIIGIAAIACVAVGGYYILKSPGTEKTPPVSNSPVAPYLTCARNVEGVRGEPLTIPVRTLVGKPDTAVTLSVEPNRGMTVRPVSNGQWEVSFDWFDDCPDVYTAWVIARAQPSRLADSIEITIRGQNPYQPPTIDVREAYTLSRNETITIPVTVSLSEARDSLSALRVEPTDGTEIRQIDAGRFVISFTPSDRTPNRHRLTVEATGRGGTSRRSIALSIARLVACRLDVTMNPPSHVFVDGLRVTAGETRSFSQDLETRPTQVVIMNPAFPLTVCESNATGDGQTDKIHCDIDLRDIYSHSESTLLRYNIYDVSNRMSVRGLKRLLRINGEALCEPRKDCWRPVGKYFIQPNGLRPADIDSIRFNGVDWPIVSEIFDLKPLSEDLKFNLLVYYTH